MSLYAIPSQLGGQGTPSRRVWDGGRVAIGAFKAKFFDIAHDPDVREGEAQKNNGGICDLLTKK